MLKATIITEAQFQATSQPEILSGIVFSCYLNYNLH